MAPEVLASIVSEYGAVATPASDVYMLGGLMFEVLTCGRPPYYWFSTSLVRQRRSHAANTLFRPVGIPADILGLGNLSVVKAAVVDGVDIPWRVAGASTAQLSRAIDLMEQCMASNPTSRPLLGQVLQALETLSLIGPD